MTNGCTRVYSESMELVSDNGVKGVLGREMGHVALGHTCKVAQATYAVATVRGAVGASRSDAPAALSGPRLGEFTESLINAQFSQPQESDADDSSCKLLKKRGVSTRDLITTFEKLVKLGGGDSSMFDSHPSSQTCADHIRQRIAAGRK